MPTARHRRTVSDRPCDNEHSKIGYPPPQPGDMHGGYAPYPGGYGPPPQGSYGPPPPGAPPPGAPQMYGPPRQPMMYAQAPQYAQQQPGYAPYGAPPPQYMMHRQPYPYGPPPPQQPPSQAPPAKLEDQSTPPATSGATAPPRTAAVNGPTTSSHPSTPSAVPSPAPGQHQVAAHAANEDSNMSQHSQPSSNQQPPPQHYMVRAQLRLFSLFTAATATGAARGQRRVDVGRLAPRRDRATRRQSVSVRATHHRTAPSVLRHARALQRTPRRAVDGAAHR